VRSPLAEALAGLARALGRLRVKWYLFGAQAALLYGAARLTADIGVTVQLGDRETVELVRALERVGFRLRVRDVDEFLAKTRVLPFLHPGSGMPIDIVLAGPGLEELFFKRRRRRTVDGVPVPVASPEDVVLMKVLAGRGKDEDDAVAILAAQPKLDVEWVRGTLHTLERARDQSDLSPRLEKLLVRAHWPSSRTARLRRTAR